MPKPKEENTTPLLRHGEKQMLEDKIKTTRELIAIIGKETDGKDRSTKHTKVERTLLEAQKKGIKVNVDVPGKGPCTAETIMQERMGKHPPPKQPNVKSPLRVQSPPLGDEANCEQRPPAKGRVQNCAKNEAAEQHSAEHPQSSSGKRLRGLVDRVNVATVDESLADVRRPFGRIHLRKR